MGALTPTHLILILVIALVIIGPGRLPEVGAALGKSIKEFKKASGDIVGSASAAAPVAAPAAQPVAYQPVQPVAYQAPYQVPAGAIVPPPPALPNQAPVQYYPVQPVPVATSGNGYQPVTGTVIEPPSGSQPG